MNVEQMKTVLREIMEKTDLTPCVVGHRGVGKTAGIIQVCREMERRYVPVRLGQMEVGDLVGIPYREGETMHWSRPAWWPRDDDPPTVVHCDELNRAQQEDTLQAIFQFVEPPAEGRRRALHMHTLSPRHRVVVTINPPDGTYLVATLDRALIDRMVMLYVETDSSCWMEYAAKRDLDPAVRGFIASFPHLLAKQGNPLDMQVEATERGWEMVSLIRSRCRFPKDLEMEVYAGIIGKEAAVQFLAWNAEQRGRPLAAGEILDEWDVVAERAARQREDLQAATVHDVVAAVSVAPLEGERAQNLVRYLAILPRDQRFAMVKSLLKIPAVAAIICRDEYDHVIYDAIRQISAEVS